MATTTESGFSGPNTRPAAFTPNPKEVAAFEAALLQPEFRAMLADYAKEVSDPDNQKMYRREMSELEAERGFVATFLQPQPGYVIKTRVLSCQNEDEDVSEGFGKLFINVCSDPNIKDAQPKTDVKDNRGRIAWAIPYSTSKARRDLDKAGQNCMVYDVIFNPNVIKRTQTNFNFREIVNSTALEGVENAFKLKLDRKRLRFPRLQFKGSVHTSVIRRAMTDQEKDDQKSKNVENNSKSKDLGPKPEKQSSSPPTKEPQYVIKYRYNQSDVPTIRGDSDPCRPTSIIVEVSLPEMSSAKGIELDVLEHLLTLESKDPVAYKLVLKLPYSVCEDQGSAKFDKSQHNLVVTLPVKAKEPVSRLISTDSGINMEFDEQEEVNVETQSWEKENHDQDLDTLERSLPPYTCNIYEGLMVFTINVRNVVADSLERSVLEGEKGYQLTFHTMGQGFVPFHYGFCLAFDFESTGSCSLDDMEVEVWDNNMILQLSMPKKGCSVYQVGSDELDLGEPMALPRLEIVKEKFQRKDKVHDQLTKVNDLDSDDSEDPLTQSEEKERHSSGESNDSAISVSPPQSPSKRFLVIPANFGKSNNSSLRGILKRSRALSESQADYLSLMTPSIESGSTITEEDEELTENNDANSCESKKSVRFNEVVQRQVYRQNSSILGQKMKNMKKAEQKRRKADQKRRASEGDLPDSSLGKSPASYFSDSDNIPNDSGLASSVDESSVEDKGTDKKQKKGSLKKGSKNKSNFEDNNSNHHQADLIFNLDF